MAMALLRAEDLHMRALTLQCTLRILHYHHGAIDVPLAVRGRGGLVRGAGGSQGGDGSAGLAVSDYLVAMSN
jgi:hypothetical protein